MNGTYETKKYSADKIALLGLFVIALLTARLIIASRSAVVLSGLIRLGYTGLSLSIPAGNGWQNEKQWKYQDNAFTLGSAFTTGPPTPAALAHCRYLLAAATASPYEQFEQRASDIDGGIAETGQTRTDSLITDWAHIRKPQMPFDLFFGIAQLPNNRQLNIETQQIMGDTDLAKCAFDRIVESLQFKDNKLLEAGGEIIANIKSKGISSFLDNQSRECLFLIKDSADRAVGFTTDVLLETSASQKERQAEFPDYSLNTQPNIQAASFYYIRGRFAKEQVTFFRSDNRFDKFAWKSETNSPVRRISTELALNKDGVMTVKKLGAQAKERTYQPGRAAIPEILLELTFSQLLDSSHKKVVVDLIKPDGRITPILISRTETKAPYTLTLEPLDGRGFSEQVHLDDQRRILKRLVRVAKVIKTTRKPQQQENIYTLERTSVERILREFPERADYLIQKNELLEQNRY